MKASDYRRKAWSALSGKWGIAILACLVAFLLGGTYAASATSSSFKINLNSDSLTAYFTQLFSSSEQDPWIIVAIIAVIIGIIIIVAALLIYSAIMFCVGSIVQVGYAQFNLDIIDNKNLKFSRIFYYFKHWRTVLPAYLLIYIFIFLWSLLFVIPGIIATYRYSMVTFILAETPNMSPKEAINYSKKIMYGIKWRLFCLIFSFIGWDFLCALTFGILNIWVLPYKHAAYAAFYRSINPIRNEENDTDPVDVATNYV